MRPRLTKRIVIWTLLQTGNEVEEIAEFVGCSLQHVRAVRWEMQNPERKSTYRRAYDKKRYGTPAYRKKDREYKRQRRADPTFRASEAEATRRYKARLREAAQ